MRIFIDDTCQESPFPPDQPFRVEATREMAANLSGNYQSLNHLREKDNTGLYSIKKMDCSYSLCIEGAANHEGKVSHEVARIVLGQ